MLFGYSYSISRLCTNLDKIADYNILLLLVYAVTNADGAAHPAATEFEENHKMIYHYNDTSQWAKTN